MARKSKDSELRETWQQATAEGDDGMRALVQRVVQQVLEAEMASFWLWTAMNAQVNAADTQRLQVAEAR